MLGAASSLTWPDYTVVVLALAVLVVIGIALSREQRDTTDFFLARRRVPWWAACLSFLATEISAVTIISVPATAYSENWEYIQFFVGSSLAKLAVAFLFIPAFYRHDVTTIYEFLAHRFGRATQVTASLFFFVTRLAGSGVRLMAAALAVSILVGWPLVPTLAIFTVVSIVYIAAGGVKAIVWTNVFQALAFLVAGGMTLAYLLAHIDGGLAAVGRVAGEAGRLDVIDWGPTPGAPDFWRRVLTEPNIVWVAVLNGIVGSMAAFGTDHDLMQRLLTVETRGESQRTLALTPLGTLLTLIIYLGLGAGLFTFYAQHPGLPALLRVHGVTAVAVCGLAKNICCFYAARGLRQAGFRVALVEDASAGIDVPAANLFQEQARREGVGLGVEYVTTAELLAATHRERTGPAVR